jgi:hypothetical protein
VSSGTCRPPLKVPPSPIAGHISKPTITVRRAARPDAGRHRLTCATKRAHHREPALLANQVQCLFEAGMYSEGLNRGIKPCAGVFISPNIFRPAASATRFQVADDRKFE